MNFSKIFLIGVISLFAVIGGVGWLKRPGKEKPLTPIAQAPLVQEIAIPEKKVVQAAKPAPKPELVLPSNENLPEADRIHQLFALDSAKLPIMETLSYTSRVPWLKDRPAWIADYAAHYATSRHFIARSLNRKADYLTQKISPGDRFNVFKREKNVNFHLLIDLSRCRMWFYYVDLDAKERVLLKTYRVGVGRLDASKKSGCLTPMGKYALGGKVAIYKPGTFGHFQEQKAEMIRIFGTRWIPFEKEVEGCTESAKGFGLHGAPWIVDAANGQLIEDKGKIGKYDSDGCIRLSADDMEEIFSIIITKPAVVELVKDFHDAKLPGTERLAS